MKKKFQLSIALFVFFLSTTPAKATGVLGVDWTNEALAAAVELVYTYVSDVASEMLNVKIKGTDEYVGNQQIVMAQIEAQKKAQTSALTAGVKQNALAQMVNKNNLVYSPLAQSNYACCSKDRGVGAVSGIRSQPGTKNTIYTNIKIYNDVATSTNHALENAHLFKNDPELQTGKALIPRDNTLDSDEVEQAVRIAMGVTNTFSDYDIPTKFQNKPAAKKYQTLRRLREAKISIPQLALTEIIARKAPVYPLADWMAQMNKSMGISSIHPDVKNGMISADAMLSMDVALRYANPSYLIDLHRKTEAGVLRELLDMEAINMELDRLNLVQQEYQSALLAIRSSNTAQNLNEMIEFAHGTAIQVAH